MRLRTYNRGGFSLMEVLISLLILLIGVTSVIALFPVAVARVRQAVLDTRCTFFARCMWDIVDLKEMFNDPLHLDPSPPPDNTGTAENEQFLVEPFYGDPNGVNSSMVTPGVDSIYFNLVDPDNVNNAPDPAVTLLNVDADTGIPILIDPLWVEAQHTAAVSLNGEDWDANRQTAATFPNSVPFDMGTLGFRPYPLRVVTTWEAASIADSGVRRSYLQRWYTSAGDIQFREQLPGIPIVPASNPANADIIEADLAGAGGFPLPDTYSSARRGYPYSWALMIQRDVNSGTGTNGVDPPTLAGVTDVEARVLVFYKRNLSDPYKTAIGAFFDQDTRVTLRYAAGNKPQLRRGMWLLECTIASKAASNSAAARLYERQPRSFKFHRVADFEDMIVNDGGTATPVISVTLESEAAGYNPALAVQTERQFPDPVPGTTVNTTNSGNYIVDYSPVIILDGLQEVFNRPLY